MKVILEMTKHLLCTKLYFYLLIISFPDNEIPLFLYLSTLEDQTKLRREYRHLSILNMMEGIMCQCKRAKGLLSMYSTVWNYFRRIFIHV